SPILRAFLVLCLSVAAATSQTDGPSSSSRSLFEKGFSQLKSGDLAGARLSFEKSLRLSPQNALAHNSLGWVLFSQGNVNDAISHFRTALKIKPNFSDAEVNLASAVAQKGDLAEAGRAARKAIHLDPENAEAHRILGRILSFSRDLDGA